MNASASSSISTLTTGPIYHSEKHYLDVPYDAATAAPGAKLLEGSPPPARSASPSAALTSPTGNTATSTTHPVSTPKTATPPPPTAATPHNPTWKPGWNAYTKAGRSSPPFPPTPAAPPPRGRNWYAPNLPGRATALLPRRWRSLPPAKICRRSWCAAK